ncbi:hypothetical protein [Cryptosporangium sp. NPDC048952]|uniref:hypothetical protein n=1 Tax=Cryptosporangium sp. NPDC048952 TaxID=3363961 RepID=UPI0037232989
MTRALTPKPWADRIGRVLLGVDTLATLGAFVQGIMITFDVSDERMLTEAWRTLAYLVFAGLWLMVTIAPRRAPGIWELIFVHKIGITLFALAYLDKPDAPATAAIDGFVVATTALAYVLCRGWLSWRSDAAPAAAAASTAGLGSR